MRMIDVGHIRLYLSNADNVSEVIKDKVATALKGKRDSDQLDLTAVIRLLGISVTALLCEKISNSEEYQTAAVA
jgi:hypothetical protein